MNDLKTRALEELKMTNAGYCLVGRHQGLYYRAEVDATMPNILKITASMSHTFSEHKVHQAIRDWISDNVLASGKLENGTLELALLANNKSLGLREFMDALTATLAEDRLENTCEITGATGDLAWVDYNGVVKLLSREEQERTRIEIDQATKAPSNYLLGTLGSLVGALAGSLVWILIGYLGFVASIGGYAIAFGAFWGYRFFKARPSIFGLAINIIFILFALLTAETVGLYLLLLKEIPELTPSMFVVLTPLMMTEPEVVREILVSLGLGLLFVGLGSWGIITREFTVATKKTEVYMREIDLA